MPSPILYTRTYSFTDFQASNPSSPLPGTQVDNELENVEQSLNGAVNAINDVRRSDGKLKNGIVTVDSLDATVAAGVGSGALASAAAAAASAGSAADSEEAAAASAGAAAISAVQAKDALEDAQISREQADAARAGAQAARDYAAAWASAPSVDDVDDGVNPVGKSAYHWAQIAEAAATGALPDDAVTTPKINGGAVTLAKLAEEVTDVIDAKADATATTAALDVKLDVDAANIGDATAQAAFRASIGIDAAALKWMTRGIGEFYLVDDSRADVDIPPIDDVRFRYIKLTAALTGAGLYNEGCLTSEAVTGSAPLVVATATISLADSPMNGQVINLLNTERRVLRAGNAGTVENDQIQGHFHGLGYSDFSGTVNGSDVLRFQNSSNITSNVRGVLTDPTYGTARIGVETRAKNLGVSYYMRIK